MPSSEKRRLIVNADDFGFTRDVNEGIVEAHTSGILTTTTLMANGAAFDHAIELARATPTLDIGCHIVFVQGQSVLHPSRALPATVKDLALRGGVPFYEEAAAQVRRILDTGIQPSHLDTHKHTHLLPAALGALVRVAHEFNIPWVRRPFDLALRSGAGLQKQASVLGMRLMRGRFSQALRGLRTTDHFTGFQITGTLNSQSLVDTLQKLPPGLTELMCHPGRLGSELRAATTRLKESRETELRALTSVEARAAIQQYGIELTNYRQAQIAHR